MVQVAESVVEFDRTAAPLIFWGVLPRPIPKFLQSRLNLQRFNLNFLTPKNKP